MTTLESKDGLVDLNWENVYRAASSSSTPALLHLLHALAKQHSLQSLVNIGLVPVGGSFIDIDPLVWVGHIRNLVNIRRLQQDALCSDGWQFVSTLLQLSLQRYGSLPFEGAVLGLSAADRGLAFSRRLELFRALLTIDGFRQLTGRELELQNTWDMCAQKVAPYDPRFLGWLIANAGAVEPEAATGPSVIAARKAVASQQQFLVSTLCGPRSPTRLPWRIGSLVVQYVGAPCFVQSKAATHRHLCVQM